MKRVVAQSNDFIWLYSFILEMTICCIGIIESDDVLLLTCEMEKAVHYSRRCSELVESVRERDEKRKEQLVNIFNCLQMRPTFVEACACNYSMCLKINCFSVITFSN